MSDPDAPRKKKRPRSAEGERAAPRASDKARSAAIAVAKTQLAGGTEDQVARIPRRFLVAGGALLPVGLGLVGIESSDVGMAVTLIALIVLLYGVHSFGRLGPGGRPDRSPAAT
jgi:hypothetical protein